MMSSQAITSSALTGRISTVRKFAAVGFAVAISSLGLVEPAAAAQNVEGLLQNVLAILTGNTARLLAVIAVVVLGILAMFGHFDFRRMAVVVIGIIVVFGAAEIVDLVTGGSV
jgi:type IV secretion system protein VirB2